MINDPQFSPHVLLLCSLCEEFWKRDLSIEKCVLATVKNCKCKDIWGSNTPSIAFDSSVCWIYDPDSCNTEFANSMEHLGQFGSRSPMMLQASFSSWAGHSLPPPMEICVTRRVLIRKPGDRSTARQVLEQGLQEDQLEAMQSLGMTQDWKVKGPSSCVQRLLTNRK